MKILSKFKDYYDYAAGFDTDPRKIYERIRRVERGFIKCEFFVRPHQGPKILGLVAQDLHGKSYPYYMGEIWFCDVRYPYLYEKRENIYWYRYEAIPETIRAMLEELHARHSPFDVANHFDVKKPGKKYRLYRWDSWLTEKEEKVNTRLGVPVAYTWLREGIFEECVLNGALAPLKFAQVLSPQEAFTILYNWIPYHEPAMPSDPTDMGRFENKGFDKKTSFRGK